MLLPSIAEDHRLMRLLVNIGIFSSQQSVDRTKIYMFLFRDLVLRYNDAKLQKDATLQSE